MIEVWMVKGVKDDDSKALFVPSKRRAGSSASRLFEKGYSVTVHPIEVQDEIDLCRVLANWEIERRFA